MLEELDTGEIDIELTGFDMVEIEDLMTQFHVPEEIIEDEVPEPPKEAITKPGRFVAIGSAPVVVRGCNKKGRCGAVDGREESGYGFYRPALWDEFKYRLE